MASCLILIYLIGIRSHAGRWAQEVVDVAENDVAREAVAREPVLLDWGHSRFGISVDGVPKGTIRCIRST